MPSLRALIGQRHRSSNPNHDQFFSGFFFGGKILSFVFVEEMSRKGSLPSKPPRREHAHAASSLTGMPPHAQPPPPSDTSALPIAPSRSYPGSLPSPEQSSSASSLSSSNSDVSLGLVKLNVGGKRYYTTLSTLKGEQLPPNSTGPGFVRDNMLVRANKLLSPFLSFIFPQFFFLLLLIFLFLFLFLSFFFYSGPIG